MRNLKRIFVGVFILLLVLVVLAVLLFFRLKPGVERAV